jgi:Ca-activated chloride channel family protein
MLLVLALARPQTGSAREVIQGQGIDIVLALDISSSMAATDFVPNRLAAAKGVIADFIAERDFDRIGLVVFARSAYHQAPPTLDYDVLLTLLEQVSLVTDLREVEGRSLDGTAVGLGLASSANMLRGEEQAPSQVIVLLTDGDNNAGLDPLQAAEAAAALGIRIYTIGMGRTGRVEIPDQEGNLVPIESNLDEETLREIAQTADGLYFRAEDENALQAIYDQIDTFERSDAERVIYVRWRDLAFPWMLVALGLMVGDRVLRHTVFQVVP